MHITKTRKVELSMSNTKSHKKRPVIAGVYLIRNRCNGKIYIGQSKDILKRFRQYEWGATSDRDYSETKHPVTKAIREEGIENFDFTILASGSRFNKLEKRLELEAEYIQLYHSDDPKRGYNESCGSESTFDNFYSRPQKFRERIRRADPVFLYNIETEEAFLYFSGAKGIADEFGTSKDIVSHAVNRGLAFQYKYYVIPARKDKRDEVLKKRLKQLEDSANASDVAKCVASRTTNNAKCIKKAFAYIDEIAPKLGFEA